MNESVRKLLRLQLLLVGIFVLNKFILRPAVLAGEYGAWPEVFVLSLPNFIEGIVGIILLMYPVLIAREKELFLLNALSLPTIYLGVTLLAAIYVILQECKIHNLGGRNTYDPLDVLFSVFGVLTGYLILLRWQPKV